MAIKTTMVSVMLAAVLLAACGPSIKTEKIAFQQAGKRGPMTLDVRPGEGISAAEAFVVKRFLSESFSSAGYGPVSLNGFRGSTRTVELVVTKFERLSPSDNTAMAAGLGGTFLCFLVAPCLLIPGYNEPQVEISAEVTARQNGKVLFEKVLSDRAKASSNAFDRGSEDLHRQLEELAVRNLSVQIVKLLERF